MLRAHAVDDLLDLVGAPDQADVAVAGGNQRIGGLPRLRHEFGLVDVLELLEPADGEDGRAVVDDGQDHAGLPGELALPDHDRLDVDLVAGELPHDPLHDPELVLHHQGYDVHAQVSSLKY